MFCTFTKQQHKLEWIIIKLVDPRSIVFRTDQADDKVNIIIDKISNFHFYGNRDNETYLTTTTNLQK